MAKLKKIFLVLLRNLIKIIDPFNPRLYMKCYNWYLKNIGVQLNHKTPRFIHPSCDIDGKDYSLIELGDNCVISKNVLLLTHDYSITCALRAFGDEIKHEAYYLKPIKIGDNVFVGANVSILPGTTIENNCIIGAGSVVKGHIENNSIVIGNPAKVVAKTSEWAAQKKRLNDYVFEKADY